MHSKNFKNRFTASAVKAKRLKMLKGRLTIFAIYEVAKWGLEHFYQTCKLCSNFSKFGRQGFGGGKKNFESLRISRETANGDIK